MVLQRMLKCGYIPSFAGVRPCIVDDIVRCHVEIPSTPTSDGDYSAWLHTVFLRRI